MRPAFDDRSLRRRTIGFDVGFQARPKGLAFGHQVVSVVGEAIDGALGEQHVVKHREPFVGVAIAGD